MKTYKQIISEVGQLGYEYAAGIESSYKEDGLPLDEMSHSELFDYFTAGGDAFPEQAWSWAGEYEWINDDGTILYLDECGNIKDGTADELEDTFNTAIRRYINEHYSKLMVADDYKLRVVHNFVGNKFKWLYAKYAYGCNPNHHCTNAIRGRYSKKFSRNNPDFTPGSTIILDEFPTDSWDAIYICGVSSSGYTKHQNYIHNVHIALIPAPGRRDHWEFENWVMDLENGYFEYVPSEKEIPAKYLSLPEQFWTCRMFRWAVWHYRKQIGDC